MKEMILILIGSALVNNVVLSQFLGLCPFLGVSKKTKTAASMGAAVIFVIMIASAVTYAVHYMVLVPLGMVYMQTIVFILVIAALVQLLEIVLKKYIPSLYNALGIYLPLITTNCAVLGVTMLVLEKGLSFVPALVNAFGSGIGFLVAMVLFSGIRERFDKADVPEFMKGLPITLVAASLVAVSFLGFQGIV